MHPFVRGTSCENVELQGSENAENALGLFGGGGGEFSVVTIFIVVNYILTIHIYLSI
jgi:hypothetical protein